MIVALAALALGVSFEPAPEGAAAAAALGREVDAAAVRAAVARDGFWSGAPPGVAACADCHPDVAAQWQTSAHRFASFNNPFYAAAAVVVHQERGAAGLRFCANCHDPWLVALDAEGALSALDAATPAAQAGITCLICHSVAHTPDRRGNGDLAVELAPIPYDGPGHGARLRSAVLGTSLFCGACHKVGLLEEVTDFHWQRGQNDFDAWYDSAASGRGVAAVLRPARANRCQDCHMPLEPAVRGDAAAKAGQVRSHRFLGGNTALPHLRGDADATARQVELLHDAVALHVFAEPGRADVVLQNRRVGHRFPGGTTDSNEVWLEVVAYGADGGELAASGRLDPAARLDPGAHRVRAQPVDGDAMPLARRDVQRMRGVAFDTSLGPADPRLVRYALPLGATRVRARLLYRKFDAEYQAFACRPVGGAARRRCESLPVVEIAAAEAGVAARSPDVASPGAPIAMRGGAPSPGAPIAMRGGAPSPGAPIAMRGGAPSPGAPIAVRGGAPSPGAPIAMHGGAPSPGAPIAMRGGAPSPGAPIAVRGGAPSPGAPVAWEAWLAYGLALADAQTEDAPLAAPVLQRAAALAPERPEPRLGAARLALALGQTDRLLELLDGLDAATGTPLTASLWLRAQGLHRAHRNGPALAAAERLLVRAADDRAVLGLTARLRGIAGDARGALAAAEALLAVDPESEEGLYQRLLGRRAAGLDDPSSLTAYLRHRRDVENDRDLRDRWRRREPDAREWLPLHEHALQPPTRSHRGG